MAKTLNQLLLEELLAAKGAATRARAEADIAQAKADLVRAKIEAAGKRINYEYANGRESMTIVDLVTS